MLGGERFARKVRGKAKIYRESLGLRDLGTRKGFEDIVKAVERLKGERWEAFRDKHADWGRDVVLWCARRYSGLTLRELGAQVGGVDYTGVSMAIKRIESRGKTDRALRKTMNQLMASCEK